MNVGRGPSVCCALTDRAVSRKQATLSSQLCTDQQQLKDASRGNCSSLIQPELGSTILSVTDVSRFGTFVNGSAIIPQTPVILTHNDILQFGTADSVHTFRIEWRPLRICISQAAGLQATLKKTIEKLGEITIPTLSNLQVLPSTPFYPVVLCMHEFNVTEKGLLALMAGVPIVKPSWIQSIAPEQRSSVTAPLLKSIDLTHVPPLSALCPHPQLPGRRLLPSEERQQLFVPYCFHPMHPDDDESMSRLAIAIGLGGGVVVAAEKVQGEGQYAGLSCRRDRCCVAWYRGEEDCQAMSVSSTLPREIEIGQVAGEKEEDTPSSALSASFTLIDSYCTNAGLGACMLWGNTKALLQTYPVAEKVKATLNPLQDPRKGMAETEAEAEAEAAMMMERKRQRKKAGEAEAQVVALETEEVPLPRPHDHTTAETERSPKRQRQKTFQKRQPSLPSHIKWPEKMQWVASNGT